jgi:glycine dehydrogenase subunit 1
VNKAHYLRDRLQAIGLSAVVNGPVLYEFAVRVPGSIAALNAHLLDRGILGGVDLGRYDYTFEHYWQLAVTEQRTKQELDTLVEEVKAWLMSQ